MTEVKPDHEGDPALLSGKDFFFNSGAGGSMASYEKSSPIYSLLSGQRVGQIPIDEHKEIDREERDVHQHLLIRLQGLLLLLVFLGIQLPCVHVTQLAPLNSVLIVFGLFCAVSHACWRSARWHLVLNTWSLVFFILAIAAQTGMLASPFLPLCFFSIMLAGVFLSPDTVFQQSAAFTVGWILLADADRNAFSGNADYLAGPLIQLVLLWLLAWLSSRISLKTEDTKEKIRQLSRTDQLTGLWNMKMLLIFMQREYQRTLTRAGKFSVLMIDADSLKAVNDLYGHHAGTMLIVSISETMRNELREEDMLARFGGDEFVAFLPETNCQDAYRVAERLRSRIEYAPLMYEGHSVRITVSCGIACFPEHGDDLTEIMKKADRALYRSKDLGKNCCTIHRSEDERHQPPPEV